MEKRRLAFEHSIDGDMSPEFQIQAHKGSILGLQLIATIKGPAVMSWGSDGRVLCHDTRTCELIGELRQGYMLDLPLPPTPAHWNVHLDVASIRAKEAAKLKETADKLRDIESRAFREGKHLQASQTQAPAEIKFSRSQSDKLLTTMPDLKADLDADARAVLLAKMRCLVDRPSFFANERRGDTPLLERWKLESGKSAGPSGKSSAMALLRTPLLITVNSDTSAASVEVAAVAAPAGGSTLPNSTLMRARPRSNSRATKLDHEPTLTNPGAPPLSQAVAGQGGLPTRSTRRNDAGRAVPASLTIPSHGAVAANGTNPASVVSLGPTLTHSASRPGTTPLPLRTRGAAEGLVKERRPSDAVADPARENVLERLERALMDSSEKPADEAFSLLAAPRGATGRSPSRLANSRPASASRLGDLRQSPSPRTLATSGSAPLLPLRGVLQAQKTSAKKTSPKVAKPEQGSENPPKHIAQAKRMYYSSSLKSPTRLKEMALRSPSNKAKLKRQKKQARNGSGKPPRATT